MGIAEDLVATNGNYAAIRSMLSMLDIPLAGVDLRDGSGLDRANWTHEELADHLNKTKGIRTSRSAVQRFCSKIGIRRYRPTSTADQAAV